ncbi:MAG: tRNA (N6-threonylcarbamoyladenosine(37)-N6)-methyltransferase TrmO [Coriobacteriia bacterium]|nr:tRNA (N6-threonylcarbamoyladenosine(37)-N6)-methyltransferase TrmO [Coriobacteriia bacterium]
MIPELYQIGTVHSALDDPNGMPLGGGEAVIDIDPKYSEGLKRLEEHSHIWILTWFHKSNRTTLSVVPAKIDPNLPKYGVFAIRAFMRPNPIGLSRVKLKRIEGNRIYVSGCDAIDGTPLLDIKSYYEADCVFSPRAPYLRSPDRRMRWELMLRQAVDHHQETCEGLLLATRMAFAAEEVFGTPTNPDITVHIQGSPCVADAIQGITRARLSNPRRFFFTEQSGPAVTVWENDRTRLTITDLETGAEYSPDVADDKLFIIEREEKSS